MMQGGLFQGEEMLKRIRYNIAERLLLLSAWVRPVTRIKSMRVKGFDADGKTIEETYHLGQPLNISSEDDGGNRSVTVVHTDGYRESVKVPGTTKYVPDDNPWWYK